ncbi:DUF262 domain-containing protein [Listeria innocua]|uniref:DUF262 domain-containing protein n=1 Tax=Listeria innocua TaxID=1642 RepID=UPI00162395FF|nr:DUF262 domain-containing protein [Listeria innocua]MBC2109497.1 DUF262 domain-containing protein [Listeria innocua]
MEEINSTMESVSEIFLNSSNIFHIPDFQRDFVWSRQEAEDLMEDFSEDTDNFEESSEELQGYLLGNIVLIEKEKNKYLVVDGQQRITSLTLLFKVLYQRIKDIIDKTDGDERDKWLKRMGQLNQGYEITDDEDNFKSLRVTHDDSLPFGKYYKSIIRDEDHEEAKTQSDINISEVYDALSDKLSELTDDKIYKFIPYLKTKVKLITTTSSSEGKAFQLFEVLNDRGRSLEPMDLVKNNFLKTLNLDGFTDEEIETFNSNWRDFIENLTLKKAKRKIASSTFMKHFIVSEYGINMRQEKLFDFFTNTQKLTGKEIIELAYKLKKTSEVYASIEDSPLENQFLQNDNNMYILFKILRIKQLHPILITFYNADAETKKNITDSCVRYGATLIFSLVQTNVIEKELPNIVNKMQKGDTYEGKNQILYTEINTLIKDYEEQLKNTIKSKNFIGSNGKPITKSIDILKFIEIYFLSNNLVKIPPKKITLEHILATQTKIVDFTKYGFTDKEDFIRHINKIGNLTLLYSDENSSAGTKDVVEKIGLYRESEFLITKSIMDRPETAIKNGKESDRISNINEHLHQYNTRTIWTKENINKRSEDIANLLVSILLKK